MNSNSPQDLLQFADLLARINEQVQLRDAFENDLPAYAEVRNMADEFLGVEHNDAKNSQRLDSHKRRLLELANNIHRMDYFEFKEQLDDVVQRIRQHDSGRE